MLACLLALCVVGPAVVARPAAPKPLERAYAGAPPAIPHAVDQSDGGSCMACHEAGLPDDGAIAVPHRAPGRCMACHVASDRKVKPFVANRFVGVVSLKQARASAFAPPVVPHTLLLHDVCLSCHGPDGYASIRTPHPERTPCTQCHVQGKAGSGKIPSR